MSKIQNLLKCYTSLRSTENLLDTEVARHQKNPEASEIDDGEYAELYHAYNCIVDAEAALFGALMMIDERQSEEDEWWVPLEETPEMQIPLDRHSKCNLETESKRRDNDT